MKKAKPASGKAKKAAPARRTQRERRETTIAKLIEATLESLLEVGYARTSVQEICRRAGVSHGGLFRHFPSLLDLIMAATEEVAQRQIARAEAGFAEIAASKEPLVAAIKLIREGCRTPINVIFFELIIAARTDPALKKAAQSFGAKYASAINDAVTRAPVSPQLPPGMSALLATSLMHLFDGETLTREFFPNPELENQRMAMLIQMARLLSAGAPMLAGAKPKQAA